MRRRRDILCRGNGGLNGRRQEDERKRREEELRRLRALKRQEIENKLKEIQTISGVSDKTVSALNLDEDWDAAKYDEEMGKMFDDEYYEEAGDEEKPDVHLEELFDEEEMPEELKEELRKKEPEEPEEEPEEKDEKEMEVEDEELLKEPEEAEEAEKKAEEDEEVKKARKEADKLMDELYSLDYEDMIGDTPCRFHYTRVRPASYGLSTEDILNATDKELRQYVSIKKLAPYRDHEWRIGKGTAGKFKAMLQKRMKREASEEQLSRKEEKKLRKKQLKEQKQYLKQLEEEKAKKKNRKRSKKH